MEALSQKTRSHLEKILDRMVSLDLNHRYANVLQVQQALRQRVTWRSLPTVILGGLGLLTCIALAIDPAYQFGRQLLGMEPSNRLSHLRHLLDRKEWDKAEAETQAILFQRMGQPTTQDRMFYLDQWNPQICATVRTLDTLWQDASGQQYGWSAQQQIYRNLAPKSVPQFLGFYNALEWQQVPPPARKVPKGHYPHIFRGDAPATIQKFLPRLFACLS
ncbi:MAG: hypothetical protein HC919_00830 [Oscillatoriales cyanobacterium SM2_2_1]|nr:hypothetical protein [Oscillatoriales cyanobacterium SM2_2_1]